MTIVVSYKSEILGSGIFWKGAAEDIGEIRNIPARKLAEKCVLDDKTRTVGMWTVSTNGIPE